MSTVKKKETLGYLPDESPTPGKLILFALQQVLVMFPATVTVALLTGFHVSTTIFASGFATICFLLITKGQLPLYYGSSFSYISAIVGITHATYGVPAESALISQAQFGVIMSGLISIAAGIIVNYVGMDVIEKILPPTVTGGISLIIGLSLAGSAMTNAIGYDAASNTSNPKELIVAMVTLIVTILCSVYLKGILGQLPILFGIAVGYIFSLFMGLVDFSQVFADGIIAVPPFTLPTPNWTAVAAIMPIAIATIPESTAHVFQLDIYVNDLSSRKNGKKYKISDKLGLNLIGDGAADIISAAIGGPAGTNYGENISTMAITKNFSIKVLGASAIIAMLLSFVSPLSNLIKTIPPAVMNGACIFLFGVIGAQGVAIMMEKKVDMFSAKNMAVISVIFTIGLGGHYGFPDGMIPIGQNVKIPAIATAAIFGILLNAILSFRQKNDSEKSVDQL